MTVKPTKSIPLRLAILPIAVLIALLGTNVIITAATIPAYRIVTSSAGVDENLLIYVTLVILIWNLAVLSLILKRSLEISTHLSAMISFSYFIMYQVIVFWFFS